jgi:lipopolysaccharide transport system permease protein
LDAATVPQTQREPVPGPEAAAPAPEAAAPAPEAAAPAPEAAAPGAPTAAPAHPPRALTRTVLEAKPGWWPMDFSELWQYRDLLWFLAVRDIKVRYKQTALGVAWAVLQPLFMMVVFYVFFGRLGKLGPEGVPYMPWVLAGLVPWQLFSNALSNASNSLVAEQRLISKVYFPRVLIPTSSVLGGLVDFAIALCLLLVLMPFFGVYPSWQVVTLPLFLVLAVVAALAVSLWLSALNVQYRDVRYTLGFLTQLWLFLTPVIYESSRVPEKWRPLYGLNPMAGVVDGFRWALLGGSQPPPGPMLLVSALMTLLLLVGGLFYFGRMERQFADVV